MIANVLSARGLVAMVVAAVMGTWGVSTHPVDTENPFLGLIALQNPPVFRALAYGYATLWFSTTFFAASLVLSVRSWRSAVRRVSDGARCHRIRLQSPGPRRRWSWASHTSRARSAPHRRRRGSPSRSVGSTRAS